MPILSGVGNLIGGLFGASTQSGVAKTLAGTAANAGSSVENTAGAASQNTYNATNNGVGGIQNAVGAGQAGVTGAAGQANGVLGNLLGGQLGATSPYTNEGVTGTNNLQALASQGFQAPTADQVQNTPGYQFQLQQGLNGLQQQLGASGGGATGGALKALTQYGQGVASTYYQNAFNNSLNAYNTNVNTNLAMAGQGLQGAGMAQQASENYGNLYNLNTMGAGYYNAGLGLQGAQSAGQLGVQGNLGAGNQWLQGMESGANLYMQGAEGSGAARIGAANSINTAIGGAAQALGGIGAAYFPGIGGIGATPPIIGGTAGTAGYF